MWGNNMRRFILSCVLSLGCAFALCLNAASAASNGSEASAPHDEDKYQAYVEKVAQATRDDAVDRIPPQYPPSGDAFEELVAAAPENIDFCIRYLTEGREGGRIALYAMYQLDVDDYVVLIRKLVKLYRSGLLPELSLAGAIYYRYSLVARDHYDHPKIQALFKELAAQDFPDYIKWEIRYIRSGEGFAKKRWRDFDRECSRWSEIRSISACVSLAAEILRVYAVSLATR